MTKPVRILTATLVTIALGCMFACQDVNKNDVGYQQHPTVVILTDFFCGFLSACIFYFGTGLIHWWKNRKARRTENDRFYEEVARELQETPMVPGLWTKVFSEMRGDDAKARALYIKYRVAQLAEESHQLAKVEEDNRQRNRAAKHSYSRTFFALLRILSLLLSILFLLVGVSALSSLKDSSDPQSDILGGTFSLFIASLFAFASWRAHKEAKLL
jgi:hypothetical protein